MKTPDTPEPARKSTIRALLLIALLAAVSRVLQPGLAAFNSDEALLSAYASRITQLGGRTWAHYWNTFPTQGIQTSFGFHNPPFLCWLMSPCYLVTTDPRFAGLVVGISGALAVLLTGLATRRLWGPRPALWAAAILALSPNAIDHARRLWGHDFVPFWTALCIYATVRGIQEKRARWLATACIAAAACQAGHLSGALLWIFPLGALLIYRPQRTSRVLLATAGATLLIYLPWLIREIHNGFPELILILNLATGRETGPSGGGSPDPPLLAWLTVLADGWHNTHLGKATDIYYTQHPWAFVNLAILRVVGSTLLIGGATLCVRRISTTSNRAERGWTVLCLALLCAPGLLFTALPITTVGSYQLPALVPAAMVAGLLVARLQNMRRIKKTVLPLAILCALAALIHVQGIRNYRANTGPKIPITATLRDKQAVIEHISNTTHRSYAIHQEARFHHEGLDYWILYLHWAHTQRPKIPNKPDAEQTFVVHEARVPLPQTILDFLASFPKHTIGSFTVWQLDQTGMQAYRERIKRERTRPDTQQNHQPN